MSKRRRASGIALAAALCCGLVIGVVGCSQSGQGGQDASGGSAAEQQAAESETRTFTDSAGRTVEVPAQIDRIAPAGHTATQVLLTMAPEKMVTLSQELSDDQAKYLGESYAELPVTGAAFGAKGDLNKEAVAASGTQILIDTGELKDNIAEDLDTLQEQLGIPVVMIETTMDTYADAYEMLGELLGMEERGRELSEYCKSAYEETTSVMAGIPDDERVRVAYLLGDKGTNTIAKNSYQGQVVDLVANNVADLGEVSGSGQGVEISMEQLALWNPELILFAEGSIYDTVGDDAAFADLDAVKNSAYYEVPTTPWNWLNSPPTVNQVLGMQWLPRLLYPDQYDDDLYETVAGYFKTFYGYDLSEAEFDEIAANAQPKA
ncbi:MAG TPA: ABC transporter substrate-binding protein [Rubneribacter badeniensis]|uniref:ABC transporter substrate-binding protein n=2 Tax=Rubneribacter badeniensis TaxID=2070688 RepID=A0A9D2VM83_9ACTN|nr:ABC transporter substrate-binding protein [Rubneribacter badeniensis]